MYEEEIHFGKLLLKQCEQVLTHLTRWPWPLTQASSSYWSETKTQYALSSSKGGIQTGRKLMSLDCRQSRYCKPLY